jgi:hypothetical protein
MPQFDIITLDENWAERYEEFVRSVPGSLFYASDRYRRLLEEFTGGEDHYLLAVNPDGRILAALPGFLSVPGPLGPVLNSLPFFGSHGGVLAADASVADEAFCGIVAEYLALAERCAAAAANIIGLPDESGERMAAYEHVFRPDLFDSRIGQITLLPASEAELHAALSSRFHLMVRRAVSKAGRLGVTVCRTGASGLPFLAEVHTENISALRGVVKPRRFFDLVARHFEDERDYCVYTAYLDGQPIAALLLFYYNGTVEYFTPAIREAYRSLQPLSLVIFTAMQEAVRMGYRRWNWGGTWHTQDGVYAFKKRWDAHDYPYHYYVRVLRPELLACRPQDLTDSYPYYYSVPFSALTARGNM